MNRSSFGWSGRGRSPISSRNSVPPSHAATRPGLSRTAPVNAPLAWPNSSLSSSCWDRVGQETVANGPDARSLHPWTARASTPLPVPLSPRTSSVVGLAAAWRASWTARRMAGLPLSRLDPPPCRSACSCSPAARCTSDRIRAARSNTSRTWAGVNGLVR